MIGRIEVLLTHRSLFWLLVKFKIETEYCNDSWITIWMLYIYKYHLISCKI